MGKSAPPDKPQESAILASMRTRGDGPLEPEDTIPVSTEAIEAEIIADSADTSRVIAPRVAPSTELEAFDASKHPAMIQLNGWLASNLSQTDSPEAAVADIIAQVLNAKSVDEVLSEVALPGLRENLGRPFILYGGKVNQSSYEAGAPYYFVLDVEWLDTNTRQLITTGAQTVISQIVKLIELDAFPCTMQAIYATEKANARGFRPYRLAGIK